MLVDRRKHRLMGACTSISSCKVNLRGMSIPDISSLNNPKRFSGAGTEFCAARIYDIHKRRVFAEQVVVGHHHSFPPVDTTCGALTVSFDIARVLQDIETGLVL